MKFLLLAIISSGMLAAADGPGVPTFNQDILPLLQNHCLQCHRPGEAAPMSFVTYREARPWAAAIGEAVVSGKMPPWTAAGPLGHFRNDWRLRQDQIDTFRRWAMGRAPEGAPTVVAPAAASDGWQAGKPDVVLRLSRETKLPGNGNDLWRYVFLDRVFEEDTWIVGLEIKPGNRKVVHHANAVLVIPEGPQPVDWSSVPEEMEVPEEKAEKLTGFRSEAIHVGLPGRFGFRTEPGAAVLLPKGSRLRLNIHYAPVKTQESDLTTVGLYLASGKIDKRWQDLHCKITNFAIPPNTSNYKVTGSKRVNAPITVYQVGAHMHLRGQTYRIEADLPDGNTVELLNIPKWNFDWQFMYGLAKPIHLPEGTIVRYTATYNNSSSNELVMQYDTPNRTVGNGEKTVDEMMGGYVMHTVDSENLNLNVGSGYTQKQ